jgi:hypothetical protein
MGAETFDQIVSVRYCDQDGNIFTRPPAEMKVRYRDVPTLHQNYALSATLRGTLANTRDIETRIADSERKRRESQPIAASAGCIFKNPDQTPAGRLIEELGFKNFTVGRARVSEVHGNFIVNEGGATAVEIHPHRRNRPPPRESAASISKPKCRSLSGRMTGFSEAGKSRIAGRAGSSAKCFCARRRRRPRPAISGAIVEEVDVKDSGFRPSDVDLAYNMIHGTFGRTPDPEILERRGVLYTGEGIKGSHLAFDKILSKTRFDEEGVPTGRWHVITDGEFPRLDPPFVVKAPRQGSSVGAHPRMPSLPAALEDCFRFGERCSLKNFSRRELTVGILGDEARSLSKSSPARDSTTIAQIHQRCVEYSLPPAAKPPRPSSTPHFGQTRAR